MAAANKSKATWTFYQTLNKTNLFAIAYQLATARKLKTKTRRFDKLLTKMK